MAFTSSAALWVVAALALASGRPQVAAQEKPATKASKVEYEGWRQYMVHCARCHGDDAVGGVMAPDLRSSIAKGSASEASFRPTVSAGRREKGMPAFQKTLTQGEIAGIYAYVAARAKGRLPAGRPSPP
jgi:cytochrome c